MSEAIAPSRHTVGVRSVPGRRSSVSRSWYDASSGPAVVSSMAKVSVQMVLLPSVWSSTEVRRMSSGPSPAVQRPIT